MSNLVGLVVQLFWRGDARRGSHLETPIVVGLVRVEVHGETDSRQREKKREKIHFRDATPPSAVPI